MLKGKKKKTGEKGFTVIEWIIASSIFFLVLSIGVILFLNLLSDKRDEKRFAELKQVRSALLEYYNENGRYPSSSSIWDEERPDFGASIEKGSVDYDNLASLLSFKIPELPKDPFNPANSPVVSEVYIFKYVASPDGRDFSLVFNTEDANDASPVVLRGW